MQNLKNYTTFATDYTTNTYTMHISYSRLKIIFFLLAFLLTPHLHAAPSVSEKELLQRCEEVRSLSQYDALLENAEKLIALARANHSERSEAYGLFYSGLSHLFKGETEASLPRLDEAYRCADKIANDSVKALVMNARAIHQAVMENNTFIAQQFFFKSMELAKRAGYEQLQYRVSGNLLTLTHAQGDSVALQNARMVYDYGHSHSDQEQIELGAYHLATYYYMQQNYEEAERYLKESLALYEVYPFEDISYIYALYSKLQMQRGELQEAENSVQQALLLAEEHKQQSLASEAHLTYAELHNRKGDYRASIAEIEQALIIAHDISANNKIANCYALLADNYKKLHQPERAIEYLQAENDLLRKEADINMERLTHEQAVMKEMEQFEQEAEMRRQQIAAQKTFNMMLGLVAFVLLILLVGCLYALHYRDRLYRKIVQQNVKAIAREQELQAIINHASEHETRNIDEQQVEKLYRNLCSLMEKDRLYTETQLTRERLAERLGTNRTYLTKIIKERTGMGYLQFVNSYRINEAVRILSDASLAQMPLKQIWSDLGFNSSSTFFKLFQQSVGITPSVYRKQFLEALKEEKE